MLFQALQIDIVRGESPVPIVRHTFFGKDRDEATRFYQAHIKADEFLRDCVEKGEHKDFKCSLVAIWSEVTF